MKTKCLDCKESSTGRCKKHRVPKKKDLKSKQKKSDLGTLTDFVLDPKEIARSRKEKKGQTRPIAVNSNLEYAIVQAYEGLRRLGHAPMVAAGMVSAIMNTGCDLSEVLRLTEDAAKKFGDTK